MTCKDCKQNIIRCKPFCFNRCNKCNNKELKNDIINIKKMLNTDKYLFSCYQKDIKDVDIFDEIKRNYSLLINSFDDLINVL